MVLAERVSKTVALGVALEVALEVGAGWLHPVQCQWSLALCQWECLYFLRSHRWVTPAGDRECPTSTCKASIPGARDVAQST